MSRDGQKGFALTIPAPLRFLRADDIDLSGTHRPRQEHGAVLSPIGRQDAVRGLGYGERMGPHRPERVSFGTRKKGSPQ